MRPTHINSKISADTYLHGMQNFNRVPIVPPGTLTIIHESTKTRASWAPHGIKGCYVGFLPDHHRCFDIWCSNIRRIRQGETVQFFSYDHLLPRWYPHKTATHAAQELTVALRYPHLASKIKKIGVDQQNALQKLGEIFKIATTAHATVPTKNLPTCQIQIPTILFMPRPVMTQPHLPAPPYSISKGGDSTHSAINHTTTNQDKTTNRNIYCPTTEGAE